MIPLTWLSPLSKSGSRENLPGFRVTSCPQPRTSVDSTPGVSRATRGDLTTCMYVTTLSLKASLGPSMSTLYVTRYSPYGRNRAGMAKSKLVRLARDSILIARSVWPNCVSTSSTVHVSFVFTVVLQSRSASALRVNASFRGTVFGR